MRNARERAFALCIVAAFLLPFVVPGLGLSALSAFTVILILVAWVILEWHKLEEIRRSDGVASILLGAGLMLADYGWNIVNHSNLGLIDMLVLFVGLAVAFYGIRAVRTFVLPSVYVLVLILGYQIEYHIPSVASLETFIASLMASMMQGIGVQAMVTGNIVSLNGGSILLQVDGPCTGLQGILAFGMLASMALLDARPKLSKLIPLLAVGFLGAFLVNFARLALIFLSFQFLGTEIGSTMHAYMGYLLFLAWVLVFWNFAFMSIAKDSKGLQGPTGPGSLSGAENVPRQPARSGGDLAWILEEQESFSIDLRSGLLEHAPGA